MCFGCGKSIDFSKVIDLTNKESLKKIEFIYDEPEIQLKKIVDCIKVLILFYQLFQFQNLHQKKYIEFLEKKIEQLSKENQKLKENFMNGRPENNINTSLGKINTNSSNNPTGFLDLKQIKKIEPRRSDKPSNKAANKNAVENIKIDNLNAKTAEIMKTSPGIGNNLQNNLISTNLNNHKALINVNINNSKNILKDDISNYEKHIFKGPPGSINYGEIKNENSNVNVSSLNNNNIAYQNQKRKYNQLVSNVENYSHTDKNFQTPVQNANNLGGTPINKLRDINELIKTKKFKFN